MYASNRIFRKYGPNTWAEIIYRRPYPQVQIPLAFKPLVKFKIINPGLEVSLYAICVGTGPFTDSTGKRWHPTRGIDLGATAQRVLTGKTTLTVIPVEVYVGKWK